MIAGPIRCPVLIDRERELRRLTELRLAAARGRGSCVVLSGEAGIGKSRLLAAFRESLRNGRAGFGLGISREFGNEPYGPALAALSGIGCDTALSAELTLGEQLSALAQRVFDAVRRRHRVLVVEDLQWADEGTLRFLLYLLPSIAAMRMLLVVSVRPDELSDDLPATRYVARMLRHPVTQQIGLERLPPAALRRVVRLAAGDSARLPAAMVREIVERSEGNPLFAEELLKSALEHRFSSPHKAELPLTIRAAVQERCATLDPAQRAVLFQAAVLGRRFDPRLLARICNRSLSSVLADLRRLCRMQILDEPNAKNGVYAFRHALTRDAVYATMLPDEIAPLHQTILSVLEAQDAPAYDLGYHAWAAGDARKSVRYNEQAGDEAAAVHVDTEALHCYERARAAAEDEATRDRLLEKAARAAARAGASDRAALLYEEAALAREVTQDSDGVAQLYVAMSGQARLAGDTLRSREILQRAIARMPEVPSSAKARLAIALAFTYLDRAELEAADDLSAQARALADSADYASLLQYSAAVRGDLPGVRAASAQYLERCARLGADALSRARFNVAFALCALGIDGEALAIFEALLPEVRERRLSSLEELTCANAALICARAGHWERARALVERGLAIPEPATTGPIALAAAGLTVAAATADDDLARQAAPPEIIEAAFASRINSTVGRVAGPYARWLHLRGDTAAAAEALRVAAPLIASPFAATETLLAAAELGDAATVAVTRAQLPALDAMAALPIYAATASHLRALATRRDGGDASLHAAAAADSYRALGWPNHERLALALSGGAETPETARRPAPGATAKLSAREREIAALVVQGVPNKSLARRLEINQRTVEKHLTSIFNKLGLRNRTELVALLLRRPVI